MSIMSVIRIPSLMSSGRYFPVVALVVMVGSGMGSLHGQIRPGGGRSLDREIIPQDTASVVPPKPGPQKYRVTTYITLTEERAWTNLEGKTLRGKLIAFEDMVVETTANRPPPAVSPPAHPTVMKDGKVRILINRKPFVIAADTLSLADQDEIRRIKFAHAPRPDLGP